MILRALTLFFWWSESVIWKFEYPNLKMSSSETILWVTIHWTFEQKRVLYTYLQFASWVHCFVPAHNPLTTFWHFVRLLHSSSTSEIQTHGLITHFYDKILVHSFQKSKASNILNCVGWQLNSLKYFRWKHLS